MKKRKDSKVLFGGIISALLMFIGFNPTFAPNALALITNDVVEVQGRLTDADGKPVNNAVTVTVSIYDVSTGGTARCTDSDSVTPVNGLFTMPMDYCTAADFNGDQLFMGIKVGADAEMTPRQEIYAVPYAWNLRPGAIVKGDDSYIFVPGSALVKNLNTDTTRWDIEASGGARIYRGASVGTKTIYIPITLPGVLYGQNVTLKQLTIYYKTSNGTNAYIDYVDMNLQTDADSWVSIVEDNTNLTSTAAASHSISIIANNVLSSSQGIVGLYMYLIFANDIDFVELGGVRLRLGHQ
ncbi:MAG: hypothetical protein HGB26_04190 [Desulfobulbaceae bacterium]|nr:hypothetical protein [Desulfobulbaceae bacterium]